MTEPLRDVHPDHEFWVRDGPKLKNLYDLERELRRMTDVQFIHHVNDSKNDFYNWIFHVVKDEQLSMQLAQVKVRKAMADIIERRITQLEKGEVQEKAPRKPVKKTVKKTKKSINLAKLEIPEIPKIEIPKVTMPEVVPELPPMPAVAPLPLSFEEVEARIRKKVGEMPEPTRIEQPMSHVHETKKWHHHVRHHVTKHRVHYGIAAGVLLGMFLAKYFL